MGNFTQKVMKKMGVSEKTLKFFFQSTRDKMQQAIVQGDLQTVKQIHQKYLFDFAEMSPSGENALHLATRMNQSAIIQYIIESLPKNERDHLIEDKNHYGDSPLMIATMNKNEKIMQYLINKAEAKLNTKENTGANIFIAACAGGSMAIVKLLFQIQGVNKLATNNDGQTALHRACFFGELEVVRFLIKNVKLSPLSKDKYGNNGFHLAAKRINMSVIRYLLKKFKKLNPLQIENGDNQNVVQILVRVFNEIKEPESGEVKDQDVFDYIEDPYAPPQILSSVKEHLKKTERKTENKNQDIHFQGVYSSDSPKNKQKNAARANITMSLQGNSVPNLDEAYQKSTFMQKLRGQQMMNSKLHKQNSEQLMGE